MRSVALALALAIVTAGSLLTPRTASAQYSAQVLTVPALATMEIMLGFKTLDEAGFLVDTNYCDAYGKNMTCAPNGWLRKS